jgi:signal transduction histidine kinase
VKRFIALVAGLLVATFAAHAQDKVKYATPAEAEALVKKAVAYYDKHGKEKSFAEFEKRPGPFAERDLYVTVYDMKANCLSHINPKMIGKNMMDLRDANGKYHIKERMEQAAVKDSGWQDFTFFNPQTKKVEPKQMYWVKHDNMVFAAGAYKPQ